jgi:predicted Zn-dependent protease
MTVVTLRPSTGSSIRPPIRPTTRTVLRPTAGPVRLTRRGRRVVGGLAVAAVALAAFLLSLALSGGALASNHGSAGSPYRGMRHVVVQSGQNLWSLAAQAEPGADPRLVIPQIVSANSLAGDAIYPGEQLWVPR